MSNVQKVIKIFAICLAVILIINIISWCIYGLSLITDINITSTTNKEITFEEIYQDIETIKIDAISSNIIIKSGTEFKVEAKNTNKNFSSKKINKVLKIEENKNMFKNKTGTISITVPKGNVLKELKTDTGAGKFKIDNIQAREFEMNHGAGLLEIENVLFYETDIDGGAGEIKINSSQLQDLELDAGVGKVEIEANITRSGKIECGIGELDLTLLGTKEDYSIKTEKGTGEIKINGENQTNHTIYGTGLKKIELEGGIGSINVNFKK